MLCRRPLRDHPLHHLQHVLHRPLSSRLALPHNSPLLPSTVPHHLSLPCLSCLPLHLNTTVRLSHQTSIDLLHNTPALKVYIAQSSLLASILAPCGDIHTNPGPQALSSFSLNTDNIRSLFSNDHISALNDLVETHRPNIIALTELPGGNKSSTPSELANATPSGYILLSYPRATTKSHP